jgi:hypothetical protein
MTEGFEDVLGRGNLLDDFATFLPRCRGGELDEGADGESSTFGLAAAGGPAAKRKQSASCNLADKHVSTESGVWRKRVRR